MVSRPKPGIVSKLVFDKANPTIQNFIVLDSESDTKIVPRNTELSWNISLHDKLDMADIVVIFWGQLKALVDINNRFLIDFILKNGC